MNFPEDLKYTDEHGWARDNGDGTVTVGITEFVQKELGEIVAVEINERGSHVKQDDVYGTIEAVKTVSDLYAPVSGKILEVNAELENDPELVNSDPYGKGWLIKMSPENPDEVNGLLSAGDYQKMID